MDFDTTPPASPTDAHRVPRRRRTTRSWHCVAGALAAAGFAWPHAWAGESPDSIHKARFYLPYAAMATGVYNTHGRPASDLVVALASAWVRRDLRQYGDKRTESRFWDLSVGEGRTALREGLEASCAEETQDRRPGMDDAAANSRSAQADRADAAPPSQLTPSCELLALDNELRSSLGDLSDVSIHEYRPQEPRRAEDCDLGPKGAEPMIPMADILGTAGWESAPEFHRAPVSRGWKVFVPELAIDVYRRQRAALEGELAYEYAIVFRGTIGGGGWMSNLRILTSALPIFWDQYSQATSVTQRLVEQIRNVHRVRANLLPARRYTPVRLYFTAVGHSLGGGLAQYVYLRVPDITRVVAFDPSPIDGSRTVAPASTESHDVGWPLPDHPVASTELTRRALTKLQVHERVARVADSDGARRWVSADGEAPRPADIHLLFERGEALSTLFPCASGPLWGAEGGPLVLCESVNYSRGSMFAQHNMAQLTCRLSLAARGIGARTPAQATTSPREIGRASWHAGAR